MPCFSCPGVVVTTNGTSMCTPPPTSGQAWPTYRCYQTTNVIVNASNPSNLPQQVNASFASCQTSLQCVIVPRYPCQNLPQQSACINQAYLTQYYQWYQSVYGKFGVAMGARTANQGGISTVVGATTNVSVSTNSSTSIPNFYACPLYVIAYQHKYCGCSTSNICTLYVTEYPPPNVIAPTP